MSSTLLLLGFLFLGLVIPFVVWAALLAAGLRWAHATEYSVRRVLLLTLLVAILDIGLMLLRAATAAGEPTASKLLLVVVQLPLPLVLQWLLVRRFFQLSVLRTFKAWLPTLVVPVLSTILVFGIVRPYLCEGFKCTSNAMAPTVLGRHWRGICPECGLANYCSPVDPYSYQSAKLICANFHVSEGGQQPSSVVHQEDRLLVAKFLDPQRWSIVAYRHPAEPQNVYLGRIVGLPTESVVIKEGRVWVNDSAMSPPAAIHRIQYLDSDERLGRGMQLSGSPDNPAVLGPDEYFLLGDFSASSYDSRWWSDGATGRPPYAVPRSNLIGVVTHRYWPPSRWHAFDQD